MKRLPLVLCLALALAGCASSSGPVAMGRDTYMIARRGNSPVPASSGLLLADSLKEAETFCRQRGLKMVIVSTKGRDGAVGVPGTSELVFRAVKPGDPEDVRPNMEDRAPTQTVEVRQR